MELPNGFHLLDHALVTNAGGALLAAYHRFFHSVADSQLSAGTFDNPSEAIGLHY